MSGLENLPLVMLIESLQTTTNERERFTDLQSDLESKLRSAREFNENLQAELDRVRRDQENSEQELRSQIDAMANQAQGGNEWKGRYEALNQTQSEIQSELSQQKKLTNEVRQDTLGFLEQMKTLSQRSAEAAEREERLATQLRRMEEEVRDWKSRYTQIKSQSGSTRSAGVTSINLSNAGASVATGGFSSHDGLIRAIHVTRFQIAIDELLQRAREDEQEAVLACVKSVAVAVRNITLDLGNLQLATSEATAEGNKRKAKVSATANNLITAAKNFVMSKGLSPVSLLDAAASHLSAAIIELARTVKVDASMSNDIEDDGHTDIVDSPADYYGLSNGRGSVGAESSYSTDSKPRLTSRAFSGSHQRKPLPNGITNGGPTVQSTARIGDQNSRVEELKVR